MRPRVLSVVTSAALLAASASPGVMHAASPESTLLQVNVRTVEAEPLRGRMISFSLKDGLVLQASGDERRIPVADIVRIRSDASEPQAPIDERPQLPVDQVTLTLAWGDSLTGRILASRDDAVVLGTPDLGELTIPMDNLAQLTSAHAGTSAFRDSVEWFFRSRKADEDAVLLTNGDVVKGFIVGLDSDGVSLDGVTGPVKAPLSLIVAARIGHPPAESPRGTHAVVYVGESARLTVTQLDCSRGAAEAKLRAGPSARFDLARLSRIDVGGGRWVWLSDLRPVSAEQVPMLSLGWDYQIDRSVRGGPLIVAGERYERGIGVHSRSVLIYELDAAYREFVTSFGLDDDSGPLADVRVSILVDGQRRYEKTGVRRGDLGGPVRLDVSRAGRIELVVDFGENGDIQDRFDWIEPALIR